MERYLLKFKYQGPSMDAKAIREKCGTEYSLMKTYHH